MDLGNGSLGLAGEVAPKIGLMKPHHRDQVRREGAVVATFCRPTRRTDMTTVINNVTVLGTGVLGSQIAYQSAYSGFAVAAYDISDEIVNIARKRFQELAARYEREVEGARGGRA